MVKIARMSFNHPTTEAQEARIKLATEAGEVLGYRKLASATVPGSLSQTLRKLEMEPLVRSSVDEYKRKKAKPGMWWGHKVGYTWMGFGAALCTGIPSVHHLTSGLTFLEGLGMIGYSIATIASSIIGIWYRLDTDVRGTRSTKKWALAPIGIYEGSIPEFVLAKAIQVKKELPDVRLSIDQLYSTTEEFPVRDRDPFLVAMFNDETFYVDVWDEREYEAQL